MRVWVSYNRIINCEIIIFKHNIPHHTIHKYYIEYNGPTITAWLVSVSQVLVSAISIHIVLLLIVKPCACLQFGALLFIIAHLLTCNLHTRTAHNFNKEYICTYTKLTIYKYRKKKRPCGRFTTTLQLTNVNI